MARFAITARVVVHFEIETDMPQHDLDNLLYSKAHEYLEDYEIAPEEWDIQFGECLEK